MLKGFLQSVVLSGAAMLLVGASALAVANTPDRGAHEVVKEATDRVLEVLKDASGYADTNPQRYYDQLYTIFDDVIDYEAFARGVMGQYATAERYRSLDADAQSRLRGQLDRFTAVMREGLIETYGRGLLAFGSSRVELAGEAEMQADGRRASVRQRIYSDAPEPYVVSYQMALDRNSQWKLRNVIVESVNLGQVFRSQFQAAARQHNGNLDAVIDNWLVKDLDAL